MKTYTFATVCVLLGICFVVEYAHKQEWYDWAFNSGTYHDTRGVPRKGLSTYDVGYNSGSFGSDYGSADLTYHGGAEVAEDGAKK